jgi:hypothetical protein
VDEEFEFLPIIGVVAGVLPVDCGVQAGNLLGFLIGFKFSTGELGGRDSVREFGLWPVHTVLDRFEKEGIVDGNRYDLICEHLFSIGTRFGQYAEP